MRRWFTYVIHWVYGTCVGMSPVIYLPHVRVNIRDTDRMRWKESFFSASRVMADAHAKATDRACGFMLQIICYCEWIIYVGFWMIHRCHSPGAIWRFREVNRESVRTALGGIDSFGLVLHCAHEKIWTISNVENLCLWKMTSWHRGSNVDLHCFRPCESLWKWFYLLGCNEEKLVGKLWDW